jgi:Ca2+-dependent lipid-binding protein
VGETEIIDNNLNPTWTKHFTVVYQFNKDRELLFQVWNYDGPTSRELIGETLMKLSDIMMAEN